MKKIYLFIKNNILRPSRYSYFVIFSKGGGGGPAKTTLILAVYFYKKVYLQKFVFNVFQLRNRFWTLPDGPLDLLDRYKNLKNIQKIDLLDYSFILDPWPAIIDH